MGSTSKAAAAQASEPELDAAAIGKIHSAVRWDKTEEEIKSTIQASSATIGQAVQARDPKTGNRCLHIAAQNGHGNLVKFLLGEKADVNAQNFKGQTALHMSVEYDFYFVSTSLLDNHADRSLANEEGHQAMLGIDGGKTGADAWDNPVTILKAAGDNEEEIAIAMEALKTADPAIIDKATLAQAGMAKRRACKEHWKPKDFMELMKRF